MPKEVVGFGEEPDYLEPQYLRLCMKHAINHILQEEKLVWARPNPPPKPDSTYRLYYVPAKGPEYYTDIEDTDFFDSTIKINLANFCKVMVKRAETKTQVTRSSIILEDVRCDLAQGDVPLGTGIALLHKLKYSTQMGAPPTVKGAPTGAINEDEFRGYIEHPQLLGVILNLGIKGQEGKAGQRGWHYTAISKFFSQNCKSWRRADDGRLVSESYTYIDTLPSGRPPTMKCLNLDELIAFMKAELNILAIVYVFFNKDISYKSVAYNRAVNIKVIGGRRGKTQKNKLYKTRRTRKQRGGAPLAEMPHICFGTAQENLENTLTKALTTGYVHIDGAEAYAAGRPAYHQIVHNAIKKIPRENLWITWKDNSITQTKIENICKKLGCGYIDLFLVHHSCGKPADFTEFKKAQNAGLIRHYGVSNCENIAIIQKLKQDHNIFANQIQARPPGGRINGREPMSPDFIEQCNALGVAVMLFATTSGVSNAEDMDFEYWPDNVKNINKYYIDKYIKTSPNVLMVSSMSGSSLSTNLEDVNNPNQLLPKEKMVEIENKLQEMTLAYM